MRYKNQQGQNYILPCLIFKKQNLFTLSHFLLFIQSPSHCCNCSTNNISLMGLKQSIQIQTPTYDPSEWQYLHDPRPVPQQYGLMRPLQHVGTGERIDQYEFMWPNQEQYLYYLKSLNWRHKQSDVVNTKFIVENKIGSICSQNYTARVYIEHPKIRLSEIEDIPFPENLYVLTAALDGYDKIYEHSKYFVIEQNQICVDENGHIKIWVSGDLSINYPSNEGLADYKHKGQAEMVDCLVDLIADNTDRQTEPDLSFRQYYDDKREKGKRFKEAKMIVLSYARLQKTVIPQRFEAVLNLQSYSEADNDAEIISLQNTKNIKKYDNAHIKNMGADSPQQSMINKIQQVNHVPLSPVYKILDEQRPKHEKSGVINRVNSTPLSFPQPYAYPYQPYPYQNQIHVNNVQNNHISYPINPALYPPTNYPPLQTKISIPTNPSFYQTNPAFLPNWSSKPKIQFNGQMINNSPLNSNRSLPPEFFSPPKDSPIQPNRNQTPIAQTQNNKNSPKEEVKIHSGQQQIIYHTAVSSPPKINYVTPNQTDLDSRTLPPKTGFPSHSMEQLAAFAQNDRPIYSHINPKDPRLTNSKGFPLVNHPSNHKQKHLLLPPDNPKKRIRSINLGDSKPVKYFSALNQELEIDAQIAADMERYLL